MRLAKLTVLVTALIGCPAAVIAQTPAPGAPSAPVEAPVDLRPHYKQGQTSRYWVWTLRDQATTVEAAGQTRTLGVRMVFEGEMTWTVDRVNPDGSASCLMTMDWMTATITDPEGKTQVNDSRRPGENEPLQRLLKAMAGAPVRVEMSADGSAGVISGVDAIKRKAGEGVTVPDELDFAETASDLATAPGAPGQAQARTAWDAAFLWNHELGKMRYATRYTLASVEEIAGIPVATVNGEAKLALEPDPTKLGVPPGGPKVDVRLASGRYTTQIMMDLQRGEAVGRNSSQQTRIEAKARMNNQTLTRTVDETIQSQALRIEER